MARFLGIDFGSKRIGLAISDETGMIAFPLSVLENSGVRKVSQEINRIVSEKKAEKIVLGLPLNLDGSKGIAAENIEQFAAILKQYVTVPLVFWDERLSTKIAERSMIEGGMRRERRRQSIDQVTAQIILQSYLDAQGMNLNPNPNPDDEEQRGFTTEADRRRF